jgi:hypothetical protein
MGTLPLPKMFDKLFRLPLLKGFFLCFCPNPKELCGFHGILNISSEVWNVSSMRCFMTSSSDSLLAYQTQKFGSTEFRSTLVVSAWPSKIILEDLQPCRP